MAVTIPWSGFCKNHGAKGISKWVPRRGCSIPSQRQGIAKIWLFLVPWCPSGTHQCLKNQGCGTDRHTDTSTDLPLNKCISLGSHPPKKGEFFRTHCSLPLLPNPYGSGGTHGCSQPPSPTSRSRCPACIPKKPTEALLGSAPAATSASQHRPAAGLQQSPPGFASPAGLSPSPGGTGPKGRQQHPRDSSTLATRRFCPRLRPACLSPGDA